MIRLTDKPILCWDIFSARWVKNYTVSNRLHTEVLSVTALHWAPLYAVCRGPIWILFILKHIDMHSLMFFLIECMSIWCIDTYNTVML